MENMNTIETRLLDRELKEISAKLGKIGADLIKVFSKYGTIRGEHGSDVAQFIIEHVVGANETYCAGYMTQPKIKTTAEGMPEVMKKAILDWAITDLLEKADRVDEILGDL